MVEVTVYLALVEPQCTDQVQPNGSERGQVQRARENGQDQELGGGARRASLARQTSQRGTGLLGCAVGFALQTRQPSCGASAQLPPSRVGGTGRIQAGDLRTCEGRSRGDPEFRGH